MLFNTFPQQTVKYLNQVLGIDAMHAANAVLEAGLPFFLHDAYEIVPAKLLGQQITLACVKGDNALPAKQIEKHVQRLREQLHTPVIVSLPAVAPGERKQLIQHGIAFVVPGHQLYAPQIGVILSERFPIEAKRELALASPATQALLIWFLLHHPVSESWHPFDEATTLGYAAMTATRAIRELLQFGLFELELRGRAKHLKLVGTRRELWQKAKSYLRSPVQRSLWTYDHRILNMSGVRLAGECALAKMTMLNDPEQPMIAMTADVVQVAKQEGIFFEPRGLSDAIEVQVWRYTPAMLDRKETVDPLSLWLSLKESADDRIQMALDEIEENFQW